MTAERYQSPMMTTDTGVGWRNQLVLVNYRTEERVIFHFSFVIHLLTDNYPVQSYPQQKPHADQMFYSQQKWPNEKCQMTNGKGPVLWSPWLTVGLEFYPLLCANSRIKWMLDVPHLRNEVCGLNQLRRSITTSDHNVQCRLGGPDCAQL